MGPPATPATGDRQRGSDLSVGFGLAVDAVGNILVDDGTRLRAVAASTGTFYGQAMTSGDIYTIAGNGTQGYAGDGGPATSAEFTELRGLLLTLPATYSLRMAAMATSRSCCLQHHRQSPSHPPRRPMPLSAGRPTPPLRPVGCQGTL